MTFLSHLTNPSQSGDFHPLFGFQHAAAGRDIDATALTEGAGKSGGDQDFLKRMPGVAFRSGEATGWIERDQVDVGIHSL